MNDNLPKLSIIIVTLNNDQVLPFCLESIFKQNYPRESIEYINVDGGSIDNSSRLMQEAGFKIIKSPVANAESQRAIGLREAKNEIVVYIDADIYIPNSEWLKQMVEPFLENKDVVYSQTLHYTYRKQDSLFNRYCALFGMNDPVAYYVGRPDRLSWQSDEWKIGKIIRDRKNYYIVEFNKKNLPTVGCNGIMVKREILLNNAKSDPDNFLHIDVYVDLIENGFNKFAIVKNDVVHATAYSLKNLIKKRTAFLTYYFNQTTPRRYAIYDSSKFLDNWKMFLFIMYTVTIFKPLWDGFRGFARIRDFAWFIHPIVCWAFLYAYGMAYILRFFKFKT